MSTYMLCRYQPERARVAGCAVMRFQDVVRRASARAASSHVCHFAWRPSCSSCARASLRLSRSCALDRAREIQSERDGEGRDERDGRNRHGRARVFGRGCWCRRTRGSASCHRARRGGRPARLRLSEQRVPVTSHVPFSGPARPAD